MKSLYILIVLSTIFSGVNAQDRFRVDCTHVSIYNPDTEEWSDWKDGNNTFVININDNGDIMHYKPNGNKVTYRKVSDVEKDKTSSNNEYQIITVIDEDGEEFMFQLFNDRNIGVKFIFKGRGMIQFSNADNTIRSKPVQNKQKPKTNNQNKTV